MKNSVGFKKEAKDAQDWVSFLTLLCTVPTELGIQFPNCICSSIGIINNNLSQYEFWLHASYN